MADLIVKPAYKFGPKDILDADKLNLLATPVVELALTDPVNDQNFFRNGNFYSSFWKTPAGVTCPAGLWTTNASYWLCRADVAGGSFTTLTAPFTQPPALTTSTTLSASFAQPAVNATVPITVGATAWMSVNQAISIVGGGDYTVSSITDGIHAVIKSLGTGSAAAPGATVPSGASIGPTATVSITVGATSWMSPTEQIYIIGGGNYTVASVTDATHAVITNLGSSSNASPGSTVPSGAYLSPTAAAVTFLRSSTVPDQFSLFTAEIQGAPSVAAVEFGQQISGDLSATLRRKCTFSGYIYNGTGLTISPTLNFYTCNAFNNFSAVTLQSTVNLQTGANVTWTYTTATLDLSTLTNVANGLLIAIVLPAGSLNDPAKYVLFSRLKFQIGEVATEFVDDPSLFVQAPSVDSTMLQDGCIARPSLFLPNVVPTGAYQAKSINNGDINDGAVNGRTLATGAVAANLGYTPVNKAGDTGIGKLTSAAIDTVVGATAYANSALNVVGSTANNANTGYFPSIGFVRTGRNGRAIGLDINGKFQTIDNLGTVGFLLDTVTKVDTNSYQDGSITLQKLATSLVNLLIAPGIVQSFAGPSPPAGWLVCDGSAVSRTTYASLFTAIGTYWGVGDSITTFNLPDFRGRTPIGYVNSAAPGITARTFGSRGGNETHTLTAAEMPNHSHVVDDPQHTHTSNVHHHSYVNPLGSSIGVQTGPTAINVPAGTTNTSDTADSMLPASVNIQLQSAGGNAAHDIMQPFGVLYFIIKT
jgi:microcystin-dependent protein